MIRFPFIIISTLKIYRNFQITTLWNVATRFLNYNFIDPDNESEGLT